MKRPMTLTLTELDNESVVFFGRFFQGNGNERTYRVAVLVGEWIEHGRPITVDVDLTWGLPGLRPRTDPDLGSLE